MLPWISDLLGTGNDEADEGIPEPEAVREAITNTEAELEAARNRLSQLRKRHGHVVVEGSDAEVEEHEAKIQSTERKVQRLKVTQTELETRLEEAEDAQKRKRSQARARELRELKREADELLGRWTELSEEGIEILARLKEIDNEVRKRQDAAKQAGLTQRECIAPGVQAADQSGRPIYEWAVLPPTGPDAPRWRGSPWAEPPPDLPASDDVQRGVVIRDADGEAIDPVDQGRRNLHAHGGEVG